MKYPDLLEMVRAKLLASPDSVSKIGDESGVNRGTVWRIKRGKHDPAYSYVRALAIHFGIIKKPKPQAAEGASNGQRAGEGA
jgi:transcriptional regulator with XRE-family HTH domain